MPLRQPIKKTIRTAAKIEAVVAVPERVLYRKGLLDISNLRLPDFLGIGGIKSASTWLYENLRAHPGAFLPDEKEIHYFTVRHFRRLRWYADHFADAGSRIAGEITPAYGLLSRPEIAEIRQLMPDLKLVLLIRHPVERAWSHAVMKLAREQRRSIDEASDNEIRAFLESAACRRAGDYATMIETWTSVFSPERLLVGTVDEVEAAPQDLLLRVFAHLQLPLDVDLDRFPATTVIDRGAGGSGTLVGKQTRSQVPGRYLAGLTEMYADEIARLRTADLTPEVERWIRDW